MSPEGLLLQRQERPSSSGSQAGPSLTITRRGPTAGLFAPHPPHILTLSRRATDQAFVFVILFPLFDFPNAAPAISLLFI